MSQQFSIDLIKTANREVKENTSFLSDAKGRHWACI